MMTNPRCAKHEENSSPSHQFDTGAAWENLLEAASRGLVAHGIGGFDYNIARTELEIQYGYEVMAMVAIGKKAPNDRILPELQARELLSNRKPLEEIIKEGRFKK